MATKPQYEVPLPRQPKPEACDFDLDHALRSIVALQAVIPPDAFTASILGTERAGSGVVIRPKAAFFGRFPRELAQLADVVRVGRVETATGE